MNSVTPVPMWFVAPRLGVSSEAWMLRQVRNFQRLSPRLLAWEDQRPGSDRDPFPMHQMTAPFPARLDERLTAKWASRLVRLPSGNMFSASYSEKREILTLFEETRPRVMLTQYGQTGLRLLPVARAAGVPLVVHFHGHDLSYSLDNRWYRLSLRRAAPWFDHVVVVAEHQRETLLGFGVAPERISVIPCGVPVTEFTPPATRPDGPPHFLAVSRLVASKGVDVTLDAFKSLLSQVPEATLTIIGDGPERAALEFQAAPLGNRVRFMGAVPVEQVRSEMATAHIYVQHSLGKPGHPLGSEGSPVAIAEASAMGLPVITSMCGGVNKLVIENKTGFIVPQRDVSAVTEAMVRLAKDRNRATAMGEAGRRHVSMEFDTAQQVLKLEGVLLNATVQRGPSDAGG